MKKRRVHSEDESIDKSTTSSNAVLKELENSGPAEVKVEIVVFKQVQTATGTLRGYIKKLAEYPSDFQKLRAKVAAKALTEPVFEAYKLELAAQIQGLQSFLFDVGDKCAVAEIVAPQTDDATLQGVLEGLQSALQDAEAHLIGAKAAKGRYVSLLG